MRLVVLSVLGLGSFVACGPAEGVLLAPGELNPDDTAVDDTALDSGDTSPGDSDPADSDSSDSDPSDSDPADSDPPDTSVPDGPPTWTGERRFMFTWNGQPTCTDEVTETGEEISADPAWADAIAACPACDYVFRVSVTPGEICRGQLLGNQAIPVAQDVVRGVKFLTPPEVRIYSLRRDWGGNWQSEELGRGEGDRTSAEYDYQVSQSGMNGTVVGEVRFR